MKYSGIILVSEIIYYTFAEKYKRENSIHNFNT